MGGTSCKSQLVQACMVRWIETTSDKTHLPSFSTGMVYKATNLINHRVYAVKLEPYSGGAWTIEQEYHILKQLKGQGIIHAHECINHEFQSCSPLVPWVSSSLHCSAYWCSFQATTKFSSNEIQWIGWDKAINLVGLVWKELPWW